MARSKDYYTINVHYPETEEAMLDLRKKMGEAYLKFVKDYILSLHIRDTEKNILYEKTSESLLIFAKED